MADNKKYISKIVKGSDTLYIKDEEARELIDGLSNAMHYIGIADSSTPLSDGLIMIDPEGGEEPGEGKAVYIDIDGVKYYGYLPSSPQSDDKLLKSGDVAFFTKTGATRGEEYVYNASTHKWNEFGSTGSLGSLAYQNSASGSYTPQGSNASSSVTFASGSGSDFVTGYNNDGVADQFSAGTLPSLGSAATGNFNTDAEKSSYNESTETLTLSAASTSSAVTAQGTFSEGSLPSFTAGSCPTLAKSKALTASDTGTAAAQTFSGTAATITVS